MQLDTFPAISDFRASVEGGSVGVYGIDISDSQTK